MKTFLVITVFLFLFSFMSAHNMGASCEEKHEVNPAADDIFFIPEDITLEDDAFHVFPLHVEDWYFEAFFYNNYSMVLIVTVLSNGQLGMALTGFYLYHNGHLEYTDRVVALTPLFSVSEHRPFIQMFGEDVIRGDIDEAGNLWYTLSFEKDGYGVSLIFVNETKGWKGQMSLGWWLAVPQCHVEGDLVLGGDVVAVNGMGYHDHNIFLLSAPLFERGYIDGKLLDESFSIVWGNMLHTRWRNSTFAVMSREGKYYSLPQKNISIREASYIRANGRRIPTEVSFSFHASDEIHGFLHMTAVDFHHIRLPFLRYWRYHVLVEGTISIEGVEQNIKKWDMMELMMY